MPRHPAAAARSSARSKGRRRAGAVPGAVLICACVFLGPAVGAGVVVPPALPAGVPAPERARIEKVLAQATISTRVEIEPYPLRLDVFDYLMDHPDFATQVTRALKLARYRIWRTEDGLNFDDGWGVKGLITPFYGDAGLRVIYARGRFEQRVLPDIRGQAVIVVRYAIGRAPAGPPGLATSMEVFAWLDSGALASMAGSYAKTKATQEALHALKVFSRLSTHLERRADEILADLAQRPEVSRAELEGFSRLLRR